MLNIHSINDMSFSHNIRLHISVDWSVDLNIAQQNLTIKFLSVKATQKHVSLYLMKYATCATDVMDRSQTALSVT